MTDDVTVMNGNEGEFGIDITVFPQRIDQAGFAVLGEGLALHFEDAGNIAGRFRADIE